MGHEFGGQVEEVHGAQSRPIKRTPGDRPCSGFIVGNVQLASDKGDTNLSSPPPSPWEWIPPGAHLAEYVAVPERVLIPWPEDLPAATAVFTEPLANGINANASRAKRQKVKGCGYRSRTNRTYVSFRRKTPVSLERGDL